MNHVKAQKKLIMALLLALPVAGPLSCAKKRSKRFEQGQGIGLESLASLDGRTFSLTTGDAIAKPNETRSAQRKIDAVNRGVNQLNLVSYETKAKLLGDVPFRGKAHHQYQVRYSIGEKYLKILKVGPDDDIPYLEHPYSHRLKNGMLAVPLVGYKIEGFYKTESKKNSIGAKTNTMIEVKLSSSEGATHVRIDYNSRKVFEALEKIDVYPSNLFEGEWYYSETVIDTSITKQQQQVGTYSVFEGFIDNSAPTVQFRKSEVDIAAVKTNYDPKINSDNEVNDLQVLVIPVEKWVDYRALPEGKDSGFEEEETYRRPWSKRDFMQLRFDRVESNILSNTGTESHSKTRLVDLEISSDYISFTLHQVDQRARVKYSLLRKGKRHYNGRSSFKSDRDRFGFFTSTQERLLTPEDHYREQDFERYRKLNRFNPNRDIVWHFSRNSPAYARKAAKEAVQRWNAAFKIAGYQHRMYVSDEDVALGDIRYNVINLIDTVSIDRLLGFGPSTTDPETGEIISATTNIYLNSFKAGYFQTLRLYIEEQTGMVSQQNIADSFAPFPGLAADSLPVGSASTLTPAKDPPDSRAAWAKLTQQVSLDDDAMEVNQSVAKNPDEPFASPLVCQSALQDTLVIDDFLTKLPKQCPEINDYIGRLNAVRQTDETVLHLPGEQKILESCYQKLLYRPLVATILHEMGHNLGLRHNFRASTDQENFYPASSSASAYPSASSSVMDYAARHAEELQRPGKYDIAAIQFGYFDTLETVSGEGVRINPDRSIAANESELGKAFRTYKYCTDSDVDASIDPLCQRFDSGITPKEIVDNYIRDFLIRFKNDRIRLNRVFGYHEDKQNYHWTSGEDLSLRYRSRYFKPIKRLYDEWRFKLRERLGPETKYLETLSYEEYEELLDSLTSEDWFKTYRPVAETAFTFFSQLAFLQARTCILLDEDDEFTSVDFEITRQKVHASQPDLSVRNCKDIAEHTAHFSDQGLRYWGESGHPIKDFRYFATPSYISGPVDVAGVEATRLAALFMLMQRDEAAQVSLLHRQLNFTPNFLDEPIYRKSIERKLVRRILDGSDISAKNIDGEQVRLENQKHFQTESDLLIYSLNLFLNGIQIPAKSYETELRMTPYMTKFAREDKDRQEAVSTALVKNQLLVAFERNHIASVFMDEFNRIRGLRSMANDLPQDLDGSAGVLIEFLNKHSEGIVDENGNGSYSAFYRFMQDFSETLNDKPLLARAFASASENEEVARRIAEQMTEVTKAIGELHQGGASAQEIAEALKSRTFAEPLKPEEIQQSITAVVDQMARELEQKAMYDAFASDFNAQMNILRRGFSALAN